MDNFLKYFYQDFGRIFRAFLEVLKALAELLNTMLNFPLRIKIIQSYDSEFGTVDWILLFGSQILLIAIIIIIFYFLVKLLRKIFRFHVPVKKYDALVKQVQNLQRDLIRANYEKDKLFAMKWQN